MTGLSFRCRPGNARKRGIYFDVELSLYVKQTAMKASLRLIDQESSRVHGEGVSDSVSPMNCLCVYVLFGTDNPGFRTQMF